MISQSLHPQDTSLLPEKSEGIFDSMRRKFKLREKNPCRKLKVDRQSPVFLIL